MANETVFRRYEGNPILGPHSVPGANSIFNSAVVRYKDGYAGVFRVDSHALHSALHLGFSRDGLQWDIQPKPIPMTTKYGINPTSNGYDPRIIPLEGKFYINWCADNHGACIGLAVTKDFKKFEKLDYPLPPYNRNGVLFPRRINGKYMMLHRPSDNTHTPFGSIYCSSSPDLEHWGNHRFILDRFGGWGYTKIGPGPAPVEIPEGWLTLIHGVRMSCSGFVYVIGGMILDKKEPWKIKALSGHYLLAPTEYYERVGDVPNVVFPTTLLMDKKGGLTLYYGCADTYVAVATSTVKEVVDFIKEHNIRK